jgi:DNA-directed RNA polymerase subunit RPC12/RpoP
MAREATCPVCNANIPINDDDRVGNFVYCSYCNTQLLVKKDKDEENEEVEVEEDWGDPKKP